MHVPKAPPLAAGCSGPPSLAGRPEPSRARRFWSPLALGFACLLATEVGHLLTAAGAPVPTLGPPAGLLVAALLLAPSRRWPVLLSAGVLAGFASHTLLHGRLPLIAFAFGIANGAEALLGAWLARRLAGDGGEAPPEAIHDRLRGAVALLAGAVAAGPAVGATVGAAAARLDSGAPFGETWALWWAADALGVLVVAPPLLGALVGDMPRPGLRLVLERVAAASAAAALAAVGLLALPAPLRVYFLPLPAMVWAALRGGSCGAAAALAGATAVAATAAALGAEPFASSPRGALLETARLQIFLAVAGATCHLLAAAAAERASALRRAEAAEARLRLAVEGAGMATFDSEHPGGGAVWSRGRFAMLGYPPPAGPEARATVAMWSDRLHPGDREAALSLLDRALRKRGSYLTVHRILRADDGRVRWMQTHGRVVPGAGGAGARNMGVVFDVTARVEGEARERLMLREVEHRAKNALQVVRSLLYATPFSDRAAFIAAVDSRIGAMARAHTLLHGTRWSGAELREVAVAELGHLAGEGKRGGLGAGAGPPRVAMRGPAGVRLRARAAQGLSLLLHELSTNAAKHGALSAPEGRVEVSWDRPPGGGGAVLRWSESGGPPLAGPPPRLGFGSRLIAASARGELGGGAEFRWRPEGLLVEVTIAADRLDDGARGAAAAAGDAFPRDEGPV